MPGSSAAGRQWLHDRLVEITRIAPAIRVIDVGAGDGGNVKRGRAATGELSHWTGVEVWEPYVGRFGLTELYDEFLRADVRELAPFPEGDVVIFGDVLEHMTKQEAERVWERALKVCRWAILSLPVEHYPQGATHGNPYERHVTEDWSVPEVIETFPGVVDHWTDGSTGRFLAAREDVDALPFMQGMEERDG